MLTKQYNKVQLCADRVIPEKAGHPEPPFCTIKSGAITGDSIMKRIPLTQGKFAIVDDDDYKRLIQYNWHTAKGRNTYYASRYIKNNGKYTSRIKHQDIINIPSGFETDHKNRKGYDNRRCNLRICTRAQNSQNSKPPKTSKHSSRYKGVSWFKQTKKWRAYIKKQNVFTSLGYYKNEIDAARAYDRKAKELFGEFAWTNF